VLCSITVSVDVLKAALSLRNCRTHFLHCKVCAGVDADDTASVPGYMVPTSFSSHMHLSANRCFGSSRKFDGDRARSRTEWHKFCPMRLWIFANPKRSWATRLRAGKEKLRSAGGFRENCFPPVCHTETYAVSLNFWLIEKAGRRDRRSWSVEISLHSNFTDFRRAAGRFKINSLTIEPNGYPPDRRLNFCDLVVVEERDPSTLRPVETKNKKK